LRPTNKKALYWKIPMMILVNENSKNPFEDFDQSHHISSQQNPSDLSQNLMGK